MHTACRSVHLFVYSAGQSLAEASRVPDRETAPAGLAQFPLALAEVTFKPSDTSSGFHIAKNVPAMFAPIPSECLYHDRGSGPPFI